jgi:hypothetical protein
VFLEWSAAWKERDAALKQGVAERKERDAAYKELAVTREKLEEARRMLQEAQEFRPALRTQNHIFLLPPVQHEVIYVNSDSDDVVPHTA